MKSRAVQVEFNSPALANISLSPNQFASSFYNGTASPAAKRAFRQRKHNRDFAISAFDNIARLSRFRKRIYPDYFRFFANLTRIEYDIVFYVYSTVQSTPFCPVYTLSIQHCIFIVIIVIFATVQMGISLSVNYKRCFQQASSAMFKDDRKIFSSLDSIRNRVFVKSQTLNHCVKVTLRRICKVHAFLN